MQALLTSEHGCLHTTNGTCVVLLQRRLCSVTAALSTNLIDAAQQDMRDSPLWPYRIPRWPAVETRRQGLRSVPQEADSKADLGQLRQMLPTNLPSYQSVQRNWQSPTWLALLLFLFWLRLICICAGHDDRRRICCVAWRARQCCWVWLGVGMACCACCFWLCARHGWLL